jgi:hypothetical protein
MAVPRDWNETAQKSSRHRVFPGCAGMLLPLRGKNKNTASIRPLTASRTILALSSAIFLLLTITRDRILRWQRIGFNRVFPLDSSLFIRL